MSTSQLISQIITGLRYRYPALNDVRYQAAWTDDGGHRRCMHSHKTLIEAAECGLPTGPGWYVIAVERGAPRELLPAEDSIVNRFRLGTQR
jgi:hypothetical protein